MNLAFPWLSSTNGCPFFVYRTSPPPGFWYWRSLPVIPLKRSCARPLDFSLGALWLRTRATAPIPSPTAARAPAPSRRLFGGALSTGAMLPGGLDALCGFPLSTLCFDRSWLSSLAIRTRFPLVGFRSRSCTIRFSKLRASIRARSLPNNCTIWFTSESRHDLRAAENSSSRCDRKRRQCARRRHGMILKQFGPLAVFRQESACHGRGCSAGGPCNRTHWCCKQSSWRQLTLLHRRRDREPLRFLARKDACHGAADDSRGFTWICKERPKLLRQSD